jgi:hypothetical protein
MAKIANYLQLIAIREQKYTLFNRNSWQTLPKAVSLHRQEVILGYPGRIPRGQDFNDTASGARHHEPYSTLKTILQGGGFIFRIIF